MKQIGSHTMGGVRGFGMAWILVLLAAVGVIAILTFWRDEQSSEVTERFRAEQADPRDMLTRLFIETTKFQEPHREAEWGKILALMGTDDKNWLESNRAALASMNHNMRGRDVSALSETEQRFYALATVLQLNTTTERPIIVQVQTDPGDRFAVAYVHPPNRIQDLREIFLISEVGEWKVRRFLGARDDGQFLSRLIAAKRATGREMLAEERAFESDPGGYVEKKRAELLAEAGQPGVPAQ